MMTYDQSLVIICPASSRTVVEAAGVAIGHSGREYTAPLSATGDAPATHYGLHTWATPETVHAWTIAPEVPSLTPEQVAWLRATLFISARNDVGGDGQDSPNDHFEQVAALHGLTRVTGLNAAP